MHLPFIESVLWAAGAALKVLLCLLAFYRQLYRRLPWFTAYLVLLPVKSAAVWWAYREWGYASRPAWYAYWCATGIVLIARGCVIAELCSKTLARHPGLWSLMRKVLILAASVLLVWAGIAAARNAHWLAVFVLTAEQGLEFAAASILTLLFAITVGYGVSLAGVERNAVVGLAAYSIFESMNLTLLQGLKPYFPWWESARIACFDAAMILWLIPLLKPLPDIAPDAPLLNEGIAAGALQQLLSGMRGIAQELKRLDKALRRK